MFSLSFLIGILIPKSIINGKPILWIHNKYEINSRNWDSFMSRNTNNLNQPYRRLCVDTIIKHCSDDEFGTLGVDYNKYLEMYPLLQQAEEYSNDKTKIIIKWDKIKDKGKPSYKRFYGPQFLLQISGSGLVAPSGMFFNARYSKFHMGNFAEERFINIFRLILN